jgi:hypothetical protein
MSKIYNALILSGGGARGAFQVGVIEHLIKDKKINFRVLSGISVGSLNASMLAQAGGENEEEQIEELIRSYDELKSIWKNIKNNKSIYKTNIWNTFKYSLFDTSPLKKLIKKHIDPKKLNKSPRQLIVGSVSLNDGTLHLIYKNQHKIHDYILAGCSIPGVFNPISLEEGLMVDGGVRKELLIEPTIEALSEIAKNEGNLNNCEFNLYMITLYSHKVAKIAPERIKNISDIVLRSYEILKAETLNILSERIKAYYDKIKEESGIKINYIHLYPQGGWEMSPLNFTQERIIQAIDEGYNQSINQLQD